MAIERVEERQQRLEEIQEREKRSAEMQQKEAEKLQEKKDLRAEEYQKMQERKNSIDLLAWLKNSDFYDALKSPIRIYPVNFQ